MAAKKKKKASKKSSKKTAKKRKNSKRVLAALVRQPLGTLVKRSALIADAISIKQQKIAMKRGTFIGPRPPTAKQSAAMKKATALARKAQRLANLAKARIIRAAGLSKSDDGPPTLRFSSQADVQRHALRAAGVAGY
jgi:hypothetical protein